MADAARSCREKLVREARLPRPGALLVPGARRVRQYPTGEDLLPVQQPSDFVYVAGNEVTLADCVCVIIHDAKGRVTAQLLAPACSEQQRVFDGCDPLGFDGEVVRELRLPAGAPVLYLDTGSDLTTDMAPLLPPGARPIGREAFAASRRTKTDPELRLLVRACHISCRSLLDTVNAWTRGADTPSEIDLAMAFQTLCVQRGASPQMAFPSIVASGDSASTLHHSAGRQPARRDRATIFDVGARVGGYCADISATVFDAGRAPGWAAVHREVCGALRRLERSLRPGATWLGLRQKSDRAMAAALEGAGLLRRGAAAALSAVERHSVVSHFMPHACGHHLGLDCHDPCGREPLEKRAVVALELGVYLPPAGALDDTLEKHVDRKKVVELGRGGVRVENDLVVVTGGSFNITERFLRDLRED